MKEGEKEYTKVNKRGMKEGEKEYTKKRGNERGRERIHESKKKINIRISMNKRAFGSRILCKCKIPPPPLLYHLSNNLLPSPSVSFHYHCLLSW
jgi:hypothetical protein